MDINLLDQVKRFEQKNGLDATKDQVFVINPQVFSRLADAAQVNKSDRVLEVGPGLGFLTQELASKAREVLAIEIDERFKPYLSILPKNVEIKYGDAYRLLNDKKFLHQTKPPTKTVSSVPYSQAHNMLHNYTNWPWYQGDLVWLAPLSVINKVNRNPILSAYFKAELIEIVSRNNFYPQPHTTSAIILFKRIPDPLETKDLQIYLRRWLYNHEDRKVKNALREGIIHAVRELKNSKVSKKQAEKIIESLNIPKEHLEILTNNIKPRYYFEIPEKLLVWFNSLNYSSASS